MKRMCAALLVALFWSLNLASSNVCTNNCGLSPLQVHSSSVQAKTLYVGILNPTNEWQAGYIRGEVQSHGEVISFFGVINAPPNGVTLYQTTFSHPIQVLSCQAVCSNPPDGSNEGPDPVTKEFHEYPPGPEEFGPAGGGHP